MLSRLMGGEPGGRREGQRGSLTFKTALACVLQPGRSIEASGLPLASLPLASLPLASFFAIV